MSSFKRNNKIEEFIPRRIQLFEICDDNLFDEKKELLQSMEIEEKVKEIKEQKSVEYHNKKQIEINQKKRRKEREKGP